jgi:hypothetical protein
MPRRPSFQFYPGDWRNDPGLRLCSLAARGLWADMLCLMHEADPYGHLTHLGQPLSVAKLARLVGESEQKTRKLLQELRENEVFSDEEGVIFSRRMVRDEDVRNARAAGGILGANHGVKGAEHGKKGGRPRKEKPPLLETKRGVSYPPPSSSSSSPSPSPPSVEEEEEERAREISPRRDLTALACSLSDVTGIAIAPSSSNWDRDAALMRRWVELGITHDAILASVRRRLSETSVTVHSIAWFDQAIRQDHARRENQSHVTSIDDHPKRRPGRSRADEMDAAVRRVRARSGGPGEPDHD